jgi:hypothetical protein
MPDRATTDDSQLAFRRLADSAAILPRAPSDTAGTSTRPALPIHRSLDTPLVVKPTPCLERIDGFEVTSASLPLSCTLRLH